MAKRPIEVSEYELAVLRVLWDRGTSTIREITEQIYADASSVRYATVQKLLERLEMKKCVRRDRRSFAHKFKANVDRDELIGRRLEKVAAELCEGSLTPLLIHLAEKSELSEAERRRLRKLIDEA